MFFGNIISSFTESTCDNIIGTIFKSDELILFFTFSIISLLEFSIFIVIDELVLERVLFFISTLDNLFDVYTILLYILLFNIFTVFSIASLLIFTSIF
ncbi:hypothetical protein D3C71_1806080 [compost metagenome]